MIEGVGAFLLDGLVLGTAGALLFAIIERVAKPIPRVSHFLAALTLAGFLVLPLVSRVSPVDWSVAAFFGAEGHVWADGPVDGDHVAGRFGDDSSDAAPVDAEGLPQAAVVQVETDVGSATAAVRPRSLAVIVSTAFAVWITGVVLALGYLVAGHVSLHRIRADAQFLGTIEADRGRYLVPARKPPKFPRVGDLAGRRMIEDLRFCWCCG